MLARLAAVALGAMFLVAGVAKLADRRGWRAQGGELFAVPMVIAALPYVEVGLGALLVAGWHQRAVALLAAALLVSFSVLAVIRLLQGRRPPCACFGTLRATPLGWGQVLRNVGFLAVAVIAAL